MVKCSGWLGKVISDKMDKSCVVAVERSVQHPVYKKYFKKTTKLTAHDEKNEAKQGDMVVIAETRPLSARKRHILQSIVERAAISAADSVDAITAEDVTEKPKEKKK